MLDYQNTKQREVKEQELPLAGVRPPVVAFLHCYDLIEDFADTIGLSLETYCREFASNYMFGYAKALSVVGVRTVLFYISGRIAEPLSFTNEPSGVTIRVLPASGIYRAYRALRSARRQMIRLDGEFSSDSNRNDHDNPARTPLKSIVGSLGTYLSTPFGILNRELRREGCQAILCQEYEYARFDACVLLGRLVGVPVFATFQGGSFGPRSLLEYLIRPLTLRSCGGLIIAPQGERQRVRDRYGMLIAQKVARIFNPLDVATWRAIDRSKARTALDIPFDARVVVSHGRIEIHNKGLDILLEAWSQLCCERPDKDLRLLLLGTGSDAPELRQQIAAMQLRGIMWRDEFVNDRTTIRQYLSAADVYTLASRSEGFPIAPTEAMACGLPVVAADAPGMAEILEGGEISGGLVVPREDANALAIALGRVLDDEAWGRELGKRARCRVEEYFSPEVIGGQLNDFLLQKVPTSE